MSVGQLPLDAWECACGCFNPRFAKSCYLCKEVKADPQARAFDPCTDEGKLHDEIETFLRGTGWPYFHQRMDMPHTDKLGTPDFIIAMPKGRTLFVECKALNRKPTMDQAETLAALKKHGHEAYLVRSMDEFRSLI